MSDLNDFRTLLECIHDEWNRAEADIKQAEQVCAEVIQPAINELRYGGRRLIDAIGMANTGGDRVLIEALLNDAKFDCHRARHDAVDAATSKIAIDLDIYAKRLGIDVVLQTFPDYPALFVEMEAVRTKIVASRQDRQSREKIYSTIESVDFPALVSSYKRFIASEPIMRELAATQRKGKAWSWAFGIIGVMSLIVSVIFWYFPRSP